MEPAKTRVGFSTTSHPLSVLIRWFTRATVSHCWLLYYDLDMKIDMVLEAHESGFRLVPFDVFSKRNSIVAIMQPTTNIDRGLEAIGLWLGKGYDFAGLAGMAWVMALRKFGVKVKNPTQKKRALFCSEAIVLALQAANMPGAERMVAEETSPGDLLAFLQAAQA